MRLPYLSKISKRDYRDLILDMKSRIKKDPVVKKKFKKYKIDLDKIDDVEVYVCPLDVSAKTKNKKIYINEKMVRDGQDVTHYLVHELIHFLQQLTGNTEGHNATDDYLEKPTEEEAFKAQINYKKHHEGKDKAEKYTEDLLDYHKVPKKEKPEKKKELMNEK